MIKIDQTLCAGCGICVDVCPNEAICLVDHIATINKALCTQCKACVYACPNQAISVLPEVIQVKPTRVQPAVENQKLPALSHTTRKETTIPKRSPGPLTGSTLALIGSKVVPRLVDVALSALENRLGQPKQKSSMTTPSSFVSTPCRGRHKQNRFRVGHGRNRNITWRR